MLKMRKGRDLMACLLGVRCGTKLVAGHPWVLWVQRLLPALVLLQLPITNYQMAPSKRGAGGGSATHKEPT